MSHGSECPCDQADPVAGAGFWSPPGFNSTGSHGGNSGINGVTIGTSRAFTVGDFSESGDPPYV